MLFVCVLIAGMLGSVVVQAGTAAATPTRNPESVGSSGGTGELFGVAATPRGDAWAVGYSGTTPDTKTLTLYWNGSGWKPMSSPSPPSAVLYGVAATSLTNAWAVGYSGDYPNTKTLILHRNGKTWRQMPTTAGTLSGVVATSPTNAWAVGSTNSGDTLILHWNGKTWRQMPSTAGTLSGVVATSPTNAWAVGSTNSVDTLILHWNGKTWRQMPSPNPGIGHGLSSFLSGVAVSSGGTIWAVGNGNNCGCGPGESLIERWNGNTWGQVPTPTFGGGINLFAVASLHSGRSWAVGLSGSGDGPTSGVILQWTGTAWTRVPIPDLRSDDGGLFGLAATSRSNAWAVGWDSAGGSPAGTPKIVILHWNGSTWKTLTIAGSANTPAGGAVSTTTTTTLAPTTTTLAPTTTTLAPTATTTVPAGAFAPFAGTWGAHEETLVIDSNGTGTLNYADLTLCPSCSMASAPQGTIEFVLTSVTNGEGMGSVTASSDPSNGAIGAPVEVSLTAASPGQFLDVVIGGQQFINFCNSSSVGQCGA
jgi:hypothetical protein